MPSACAADALVATPEQHTLIFENDSVRILDTRIGAGDRTLTRTIPRLCRRGRGSRSRLLYGYCDTV